MQLLGSSDGNIVALLSAHQSIGVPNPLKHFGTEAQKKKYLPRCAAGEISAFALTEPEVGSDPARVATTAEKTADGAAYMLNGTKLWCTNGTLAGLLVVMAVHPGTKKISAFVVETAWPGVKVEHRSHFMGLRALANGVISFTNVRVPAENLIGAEGRGLKIALATLNDGRLSIPSGSVGTAKICLEICRRWSKERVQWGKPIGRHEAIAQMLSSMAAHTFAMEAVANLASEMADRGGYDIRLEAAAAKEWNTARCWDIVDDTMQIRGGRGYETERSLAERGEPAIGVERMMRDYRINKIFEGSTEIMHLFMAREMVDRHLQAAGAMADPRSTLQQKAAALPKMLSFYSWWYPTRWLGWGRWPRYSEFGRLATHLRFVERMSRKLARASFHGMLVYQAGLQNKQAFLFRLVDVANELFAMAATVSRAQALADAGRPEAKEAGELADVFCRMGRRRDQGAVRRAVGQRRPGPLPRRAGHPRRPPRVAGAGHDRAPVMGAASFLGALVVRPRSRPPPSPAAVSVARRPRPARRRRAGDPLPDRQLRVAAAPRPRRAAGGRPGEDVQLPAGQALPADPLRRDGSEVFVDDVSRYRNTGQWTDFYWAFEKARELMKEYPPGTEFRMVLVTDAILDPSPADWADVTRPPGSRHPARRRRQDGRAPEGDGGAAVRDPGRRRAVRQRGRPSRARARPRPRHDPGRQRRARHALRAERGRVLRRRRRAAEEVRLPRAAARGPGRDQAGGDAHRRPRDADRGHGALRGPRAAAGPLPVPAPGHPRARVPRPGRRRDRRAAHRRAGARRGGSPAQAGRQQLGEHRPEPGGRPARGHRHLPLRAAGAGPDRRRASTSRTPTRTRGPCCRCPSTSCAMPWPSARSAAPRTRRSSP